MAGCWESLFSAFTSGSAVGFRQRPCVWLSVVRVAWYRLSPIPYISRLEDVNPGYPNTRPYTMGPAIFLLHSDHELLFWDSLPVEPAAHKV